MGVNWGTHSFKSLLKNSTYFFKSFSHPFSRNDILFLAFHILIYIKLLINNNNIKS